MSVQLKPASNDSQVQSLLAAACTAVTSSCSAVAQLVDEQAKAASDQEDLCLSHEAPSAAFACARAISFHTVGIDAI